jgi:sucrose phosphorylase
MLQNNSKIVNGVMLNAYPDSIGTKLSDTVSMLKMPEFKDVFSLFYVLPTFFNSDLDRGFSVIDYNINTDLVELKDLSDIDELNIKLKFDIVLNHLSVASPQFKDILKIGMNFGKETAQKTKTELLFQKQNIWINYLCENRVYPF